MEWNASVAPGLAEGSKRLFMSLDGVDHQSGDTSDVFLRERSLMG